VSSRPNRSNELEWQGQSEIVCFNGGVASLDGIPSFGDRCPLFEAHRWTANLRILEIDEIKIVPHAPLSNPFVERLIGTVR
jgi:putative transposase